MGQKINPIGYRLGVRRDWSSMWFARGSKFRKLVLADVRARELIRKDFAQAMISKIEIRRHTGVVRLVIHTARPGMVIGKKGEDIEKLRARLQVIFGESEIRLDIEEVRQPEVNAQLVAMNISSQLEKRVAFRRAVRRAIASATRLGVQGIKIICSGRLNGAEIARTERFSEGRVPLHTLRAEIEYGFSAAHTTMGTVGVKVWVFKGEVYQRTRKAQPSRDVESVEDTVAAAGKVEERAEDGAPAPEAKSDADPEGGGQEKEAATEEKPAAKGSPAEKEAAAGDAGEEGDADGADSAGSEEIGGEKPAAKRKPAGKKPSAKKKPAAAGEEGGDAAEDAGEAEAGGEAQAAKRKPAAKRSPAKKKAEATPHDVEAEAADGKPAAKSRPAAKKAAAKKPAAKKTAAKKKAGPAEEGTEE